jgi:hypothetical protein
MVFNWAAAGFGTTLDLSAVDGDENGAGKSAGGQSP